MKTLIANVLITKEFDASITKIIKGSRTARGLAAEGCIFAEFLMESMTDGNFGIPALESLEKEGIYTIEMDWNEEEGRATAIKSITLLVAPECAIYSDGDNVYTLNLPAWMVPASSELDMEEVLSSNIQNAKKGLYTMSNIDVDNEDLYTATLTKVAF